MATALVACAAYHVATAFFSRRVATRAQNHRVIPAAPLARRALIIVIDGLRYDIALESNLLPVARELAASGASGVSYAEDPTMTGAGVRVLGTGSPPALEDIVTNKRIPAVEHQHLFSALVEAHHTIAVAGDHSWTDGFGSAIAIQLVKSGLPPLIELMQPVYRQDEVFFRKASTVLAERVATVTLVHFIGTDAVSHSQGPHSAAYREKLVVLDRQVRALVDSCGPDCLIVLTSDHGASDVGHHGLGEEIARRTPLVLHGPGIRNGVTFVARQLDFAPTIATLLGAPVPAPAQGRVLVDALDVDPATAAAITLGNAERLAAYAAELDDELDPPDLESARAALDAGDTPRARAIAEAATTAMLGQLRREAVWRTRRLLWWIPGLALTAAAVLGVFVPRGIATGRRLRLLAAVIAVELGFVWLRLHAVLVQRELVASVAWSPRLQVGYELAACAMGTAIALLVRRAWRGRHDDRVFTALLLVPLAALTEYTLVWAALAVLIAATLTQDRRTAGIAGGGIALVAATVFGRVTWAWAPGAVLVVCASVALIALARRQLSPRVFGTVTTMISAGAVLRLADAPAFPTRVYFGAMAVALVATIITRARREVVGWFATALLVAMSAPHHLVGVVGVIAAVSALGRSPALRGPGAPQVFAALVVAGRIALFAVIEGQFSYSNIEWGVGRLGNPDGILLVSHALVACKFALPMIALVGLAGAALDARDVSRGLAWVLAFLLLHVAQCLASLLLTAGQYHTPYVDLCEIQFVAAMIGSIAIAWPWLARRGAAGARQ